MKSCWCSLLVLALVVTSCRKKSNCDDWSCQPEQGNTMRPDTSLNAYFMPKGSIVTLGDKYGHTIHFTVGEIQSYTYNVTTISNRKSECCNVVYDEVGQVNLTQILKAVEQNTEIILCVGKIPSDGYVDSTAVVEHKEDRLFYALGPTNWEILPTDTLKPRNPAIEKTERLDTLTVNGTTYHNVVHVYLVSDDDLGSRPRGIYFNKANGIIRYYLYNGTNWDRK